MVDPATAKMAVQLSAALARHRGLRYLLVGLVLLSLLTAGTVVFGPWLLANQVVAGQRAAQQVQTDGGSCGATAALPVDTRGATAPSLSQDQVANARVIWQVAQVRRLGDRAAVVGLATALQESGLRNLPYGDRDSVGLFQQRTGWGSRATRMNPQRSAGLFYAALERVNGWQRMAVTVAAQTVQRSAFPSAYAKHEKAATGLVALFRSKAPAGTPQAAAALTSGLCGAAGAAQCPATGMAVEAGLVPDALRVLRCSRQRWPQLTSFGGVGTRANNPDSDHRDGHAVDIMVPDYRSPGGHQLGQTIAAWVVANHARLGITYVIWNSHIWSVQRASQGWRACGTALGSCYAGPDDTAAHRDHVHVSVFGNQAGAAGGAPTGAVVRPVDHYVLTARFGQCSSHWAHCHTGLDFAAGTGTQVRAGMDGTVIWTKWGGAYGNLTKIQHPNGIQTWYAHQDSRTVTLGQTVVAGQVIGAVGASGNTTGPHLHLEVRLGGTPVDPDQWLSAHGVSP